MAPDPTIPYYLYNPASRVYLSSGLGKTADLRVEGTPAETPHNETQLWKFIAAGDETIALQNQKFLTLHLNYSRFDRSVYNVALDQKVEGWKLEDVQVGTGRFNPQLPSKGDVSKYQTWRVEEVGAKYTIKTQPDSCPFLAPATGTDSDMKLVTTGAAPYYWSLEHFHSGLMYRITTGGAATSIGFADYKAEEDDKVALVESDNIPSQFWYFEKAKPIGVDQIHARHVVKDAAYTIRSVGDSHYMIALVGEKLSTTKTRTSLEVATTFTVKHVPDGSPTFTLSVVENGENKHIVRGLSNGNVITKLERVGATPPTNAIWIVLPHLNTGGASVYYICGPAEKYPVQTLSARRSGGEKVTVDFVNRGSIAHQWEFTEI